MSTSTSARPASTSPQPPGNTGTHQPLPNSYLLSQLQRTNYITSRRNPFTATPDPLAAQLQRLVHHEGNRPPNRKILLHLRLLTYYPPVPHLLPELIQLLKSANEHICRLAHYHIRQLAPISDPGLYRELFEALESQVLRSSPARRAAATKTMSRIFHPKDAARATDFISNVFNCIGGARARTGPQPSSNRQMAGVDIPGTGKKDKRGVKQKFNTGFLSTKILSGESVDVVPNQKKAEKNRRTRQDDGAGGTLESTSDGASFISTRFGKMLVGHTVFAALRRVNRVATSSAQIESYFFDSGFLSVVPSTVRHCMALLEWRSTVSPTSVSRFIVHWLPHRNPPESKRLYLEDMGARIYFARILSRLAMDPNLSAFIPDETPKRVKKNNANNTNTLKSTMTKKPGGKANKFFNFLFNNELVTELVDAVKNSTEEASSALQSMQRPTIKRKDPLGVEFAEALINLLKNSSNRVLIEALRGLSKRRWTTWFEAPIPQGALYNSPELQDSEAYGGTADAWGIGDDEEDDVEDPDDEEELGAYENDVAGDDPEGPKESGRESRVDTVDHNLDEAVRLEQKEGWFSQLRSKRQKQREVLAENTTPYYLRQVGQGMVPALEVILRRLNGALLNDEPTRRFAAADGIIVLTRAKIYGDTKADRTMLRKAQGNVRSIAARGSSSRALMKTGNGSGTVGAIESFSSSDEKHPFQALVRPLAELVEEDPNQFVRGRAAVALLFVIASGAGRNVVDSERLNIDVSEEALSRNAQLQRTPLLLRFFRNFVTHQSAGTGIGLKLMSELMDYLVYEVLDISPDLAPSAVELTELWAMTHPTVGVCGRLGAIWEKVLSIGYGEIVGRSIFRAVAVDPRAERVASAAVIFLRRRTLDLAIITVGSSQLAGSALPEPLPRAIGVEMEKLFSLLWHAALLGPSAECRTFAVEALGGAAVLAGEPFRCCTYERLVELVRTRGFGLKLPAEHVLNCLDMLYFSRERFSEARSKNRVSRDGSNRSKEWLELVWKLAAESSSAAQILLGVAPPTGWQALGPSGAADIANAEERFGDVRDKQNDEKLKDATVVASSAPEEVPMLEFTNEGEGQQSHGGKGIIGDTGVIGDIPYVANGGPRTPSLSKEYTRYEDGYGSDSSRRSFLPGEMGEGRSRSPSLRGDRSNGNEYRNDYGNRYEDDYGERRYEEQRYEEQRHEQRGHGSNMATGSGGIDEDEKRRRERQEEKDFELAQRLQAGGTISDYKAGLGESTKDAFASVSGMAGQIFKGGSQVTGKAIRGLAQHQAIERLKGGSSKWRN